MMLRGAQREDSRAETDAAIAGAPEAVRPALLGTVLGLLLRTLALTWEVVRAGTDATRSLGPACGVARGGDRAGPRLFVFRHGDMVLAAATHRHLVPTVLASRHRDCEIVARALALLGYPVVRGSTRRGGAQAVFALSRVAREGRDVALAPDGPTGPPGSVAPGTIELARRTGLAIVGVGCAASAGLLLPTWDRCVIAAPGARVGIVYADPLDVARRLESRTSLEDLQREVARRLDAARADAGRLAGRA